MGCNADHCNLLLPAIPFDLIWSALAAPGPSHWRACTATLRAFRMGPARARTGSSPQAASCLARGPACAYSSVRCTHAGTHKSKGRYLLADCCSRTAGMVAECRACADDTCLYCRTGHLCRKVRASSAGVPSATHEHRFNPELIRAPRR